ncbi:NAD(P)-binding domain-containing protein [Bradyrhizobium erythrophlei]|uniref:Predicted flavoprotein CzcO associated with the cation diffusion facilitator CzcD n=1 Tax=Bradyrhizobium erythrophlei TaxID=1437360 RepID=A0A1M7UY28_9BRAD|nr:NAD(P)/FAD-dependent oxidoreductase [Bradyrhizobium erythrophlei]SHN87864.1 Predicted flavoprotein CzcO associated with the cation diffusion facilitator CzcD [Bradyrhizobium erythrophlei]
MKSRTDVAIVGAGPYGLSLAAHLRARGVKYRIFGEPMRFWLNMPIGINLKSLAFATNIYVPKYGHSFPHWCRQHGLEDFEPCTMQSFSAYGLEMQKRFVPDVEEVLVTNVSLRPDGFELALSSGEHLHSRKVVVCTGLSGLAQIPDVLRELQSDRMRHTFDISDYSEFRNKTVAVIGAGSSAIEAGALVQEAGGSSEVFVRGQEAIFHGRTPRERPLWERIKNPMTVLGAGRNSWILQQLPLIVYRLPRERRTRFVKRHFGPASPWWIKDRVLGKVPIHVRHEVVEAGNAGQRVQLKLRDGEGSLRNVEVDFVIAGTGYDANVTRLKFLTPEILDRIDCIEGAPTLSADFESSVPGLHFTGPLSFMCFGPLFRFVTGAEVTSRRLARHLS